MDFRKIVWAVVLLLVVGIGAYFIIPNWVRIQNKSNQIYRYLYSVLSYRIGEDHPDGWENYGIWGLDISHHQKEVDWSAFTKKSKPDFIFFKATEGVTHEDTKYKEYIQKSRESGILSGAYHFFSYQTKGKDQALHFLAYANLQAGDLYPVLDVEFKTKMPADEIVSREILAYLQTIEDSLKIKPIIYCECAFYERFLKNHLKGEYTMWISDFWAEPKCDWRFWQYTHKYKMTGISGNVDRNYFNGSRDDLQKLILK